MKVDPTLDQVQLNVARRFAPSSYLGSWRLFTTRAAGTTSGNGSPPPGEQYDRRKANLAVQVQVFRDNEPVVTDPLHQINTDGATTSREYSTPRN